MKGFKLSRDSWHFKLYKWDDKWGEPDNFCDYFWSVVRTICKYTVITIILLAIFAAIILAVWQNPFGFLFVVSALVLLLPGGMKYEEIKNKRAYIDKGPGFFRIKYESLKGKFCPKIDWVD